MRVEQHFQTDKLDLYRERAIMKAAKLEAQLEGDTIAASELATIIAKQDKIIEAVTVKGGK